MISHKLFLCECAEDLGCSNYYFISVTNHGDVKYNIAHPKFKMLVTVCTFALLTVVLGNREPYEKCAEASKEYLLPTLNFVTNALEPYIDAKTVESHYSGHHETYRLKLNKALSDWREQVRK